jgi:dipeptidyl aminopeptidase/acylaminoacyl peptidase
VPFADEDHDYPAPAPGYGVADWVEDESAVLIYDKYDAWQLPTASGEKPLRLTDGREQERIYRIVDLDPETEEDRDSLAPGADVLMTGYSDRLKHRGLFTARLGEAGVRTLVEESGKTYSFVAKAKDADRILFSRESYAEFPDLWTGDLDLAAGSLGHRAKRTDANPQIDQFGWGTAELVHWTSSDGTPLDGVLIKPAGYREGQRYPVVVYYYRFFTQRLHRFNEPVVNHRPSFPRYASHGYAVFLPDIRFEVGRPGLAATKCLVSGVQHLIEMGVADPGAIGLHGHSWSGYQTAFVITQTDLFAAAVAGAPVSNMTSSYGGIRYDSGLARQFQYEQTQSRLGVSLWENRDLYIENSPLFYADRIHTPLLIEFGDQDGAVPWTQGIELYLAMRRLRKPAYFLEYRGEPHHLTKYPNKLDYSIKMMEFFDHYLKGAPAPAWMTEGVPYRGK